MKTSIKNYILLSILLAGLDLILVGHVSAQTFTSLYSFTATQSGRNGDGSWPVGALTVSGSTLYGTAASGGTGGQGVVFMVNTDGTGFSTLHEFSENNGGGPNSDGSSPYARLILTDNTIYGTADGGGSGAGGTVFALNTDGSDFRLLHEFNPDSDGSRPGSLVILGNTIYGATQFGASAQGGTIFSVNLDGSNFQSFSIPARGPNSLILSGNMLYGTTSEGGDWGRGTVFALNTNGSGFTTLHNFPATSPYGTNSDGAQPSAGLALSGNTLYGTTTYGGIYGWGAIFAVNTDGSNFANLHYFAWDQGGGEPRKGLIISTNTLYGTTSSFGSFGSGTMFSINTDGTAFTTLHSFTMTSNYGAGTNSDGSAPNGLVLSENTLYGTTYFGGNFAKGTVFSLALGLINPPPLTLMSSAENIVLTWPADVFGFHLQSTTNLSSSAAWSVVSAAPIVVNGQNTVTNPMSGTQQFYRLSQ